MKKISIFTIWFKIIPNDTERFFQVFAGKVNKEHEKVRIINHLIESGEITIRESTNVKILRIDKQ
jgi:hypothetical protein